MSDKGFKVKNGLTIEGTVDTLITADDAGGILVAGSPLSITINGTQVDLGGTVTIPTGSAINPIFMIGGI
jgi:hypothetical protein